MLNRKPVVFFFYKQGDSFSLTNVYRCDAFENPVIQQHFRNLEALALDMMAPEDTEDLIRKTHTSVPGSLLSV